MRVLYLTQGVPSDAMVGGQISSYYRIVQLERAGHDVTALCLVPRRGGAPDASVAERFCRVVPVRDVPDVTALRLARGPVDALPWPIRRYASREAARAASALIKETNPELVFFNSLHSTPLLPAVRAETSAPCLLFCPNVQSTIMGLFAEHQRRAARRLYAADQAGKMRRYESRHILGFDAVCAYSQVDADGLTALAPDVGVEITPLALDLNAMGAPAEPEVDVLITGSFAWPPNADSLDWYLDRIHTSVLDRRPGTTVAVVGPGSESWRGRAERPGVTFAGRVDDVAPFFRKARVLAVPLRIGSGIRVKIVQAFGARLPVVSTSKGCEGLEVRDGEHLAIADGPQRFAEALTRLLDDAVEREALARAARKLAEREHDALAPDRPLVRLCERLAASHSGRRS